MGELTFFLELQVKQKDNGIFISQDKYVVEILRKFGLTDGISTSTPIDTEKHFLKDPDGEDVDVHIYSHYAGASLDRKSTTGGYQFLGYRLIFCQCKKQTVVATSSTEAEYVAAASCCAQVIWIQNKLLDYGPTLVLLVLIEAQHHIYNDLPLLEVNTPRRDKDSLEIIELMVFLCMSAKRTAWNEFSSSMASAVICLATGRKFNFSKYIFDSMDEDDDNELSAAPTPPSPMLATPPPSPTHEHIPLRLRKGRTAQSVKSLAETVMDDLEDASKLEGKIAKLDDDDEDVTLEDVDADVQERLVESQAK
nr:copia protein [Tanacetum cinerariifolium]